MKLPLEHKSKNCCVVDPPGNVKMSGQRFRKDSVCRVSKCLSPGIYYSQRLKE